MSTPEPDKARIPLMTPVVGALIVANLVAFNAQQSNMGALIRALALWPLNLGRGGWQFFEFWQLITYGFLHGGGLHLSFNLFALWMFGTALEARWGPWRFALYYLLCVIGAGVLQLIVTELGFSRGPVVGASGGIFGLLLAFGLMYPKEIIILLIPPMPIRARNLVIACGVLTLAMGLTGTLPFIAHFTHLGGMLVGYALIKGWPSLVPLGGPPPP